MAILTPEIEQRFAETWKQASLLAFLILTKLTAVLTTVPIKLLAA